MVPSTICVRLPVEELSLNGDDCFGGCHVWTRVRTYTHNIII